VIDSHGADRERDRVEGLLRQANQRVEIILDSITENFFSFSKDWRYTYLNKHAAQQVKALGKDPASLIGKVMWEEFPEVPDEQAFRRVMLERVAITDELFYPPLGEWVENHIYPSADGGLVTFQRYITERKMGRRKTAAQRGLSGRWTENEPYRQLGVECFNWRPFLVA